MGLQKPTKTMSKIYFRRLVGAVSLALILTIILGCMSFQCGSKCSCGKGGDSCGCRMEDNGIFVQSGKVHVDCEGEATVYYPIPFESIPNLELANPINQSPEIIEQQPHLFRIRQKGIGVTPIIVVWTARGIRSGGPAMLPTSGFPVMSSMVDSEMPVSTSAAK
jgi:hypothetical protein